MSTEKLHEQLVGHIARVGEVRPKKHGNWYLLRITPRLFVQMDGWSNAIWLRYGEPTYNYWTGFGGTALCYVGMNFGRYESRLNEHQYAEIGALLP